MVSFLRAAKKDAGLPDTHRRDPHNSGESPALPGQVEKIKIDLPCDLNLPGVNHGQRQILEMLCVPRRQRRTVCKNNPGNHRVANLCRPAYSLSLGHQLRGMNSGFGVKGSDAPFNHILEHQLERPEQCILAPGLRHGLGGHGLQGKADFHDGDGGDPNGCRRLRVQPLYDGFFRLPAHQGGDDVCIENDHSSKSAGWISICRSSRISSPGLSPARWKSRAISVPSSLLVLPSRLVASRKISRTSSSTLRPWRFARRLSLSFTSFSSFRTMSCAMSRMIS